MLSRIEIQNYAIIDQLEIDFPAGLAIITGETGAGKSILLGALGLVLGHRADSKVMYNPEKKCIVEATFDIGGMDFSSFFAENGLDEDVVLLIRREIAPGGKSRAFVNDTPVTLDVLNEMSSRLLDVHQQFDTQEIQKPAYQLSIIDALAGQTRDVTDYRNHYQKWKQALQQLEDLREKSRNASQEMEFISFQLSELTQAELRENEQEEVEARLEKLTAAEDIQRICTMMGHVLEEEEQSVLSQLQAITGQLSTISQVDPTLESLRNRMLAVREELQDISRESTRIADSTEYDPEAIHELNNRLNLLNRLQKKHHVTCLADLIGVQTALEARMEGFGDLSGHIVRLETDCAAMEKALMQKAATISAARGAVFAGLEEKTHQLLAGLSMEHAYIQVKRDLSPTLTKNGLDDISFTFSPNKGSAYLPLKDVASGGELSRLALCIKSLVAGAMTLPTLIFDEIDSGVSGEVARKMGDILSALAQRHQVICITHSPQIAARAHKHYWVYKSETPTRTLTALRELSDEERTLEIAKMLSGNPPSEAAMANARDLIAG